jgi:hypothetical protein
MLFILPSVFTPCLQLILTNLNHKSSIEDVHASNEGSRWEQADLQSKPTIRIEVVGPVRHVFEQLPECRTEHVTKKDPIRMLVRPTRALQSKGYTLPAIATLLSERGIAMTPWSGGTTSLRPKHPRRTRTRSAGNLAPTARRQPNQNFLRQPVQPLRLSPASRLA